MRYYLAFAILSLGMQSHADQNICGEGYGYTLKTNQCKTVAAGASVAAPSGIYAAVKYSQANSIEKNFTQQVYAGNGNASQANTLTNLTRSFTEGDRITIGYQLNERENRAHHISEMESSASSANSRAAMHTSMALTATQTRYRTQTDSNGVTSQVADGVEPDYAARAMHGVLAAQAFSEASDYRAKAAAARAGGPVPIYDFEKVIDGATETAAHSAGFVESHLATDGKITAIERLPVEKFTVMKGLVRHGRAGVAGVALGVGFAAEEATAGYVADKLAKPEYQPRTQDYDSGTER